MMCGATTYVQRRKANGEQTCGPACSKELLRQRARTSRRNRRLAELAPMREQLSTLPASAFQVLGERDRAIVRRYYGLDDGTFATQDELAQEFGLDQTRIGVIVRKAAARLLPPPHAMDDQAASTPARAGPVLDRAR